MSHWHTLCLELYLTNHLFLRLDFPPRRMLLEAQNTFPSILLVTVCKLEGLIHIIFLPIRVQQMVINNII